MPTIDPESPFLELPDHQIGRMEDRGYFEFYSCPVLGHGPVEGVYDEEEEYGEFMCVYCLTDFCTNHEKCQSSTCKHWPWKNSPESWETLRNPEV